MAKLPIIINLLSFFFGVGASTVANIFFTAVFSSTNLARFKLKEELISTDRVCLRINIIAAVYCT